MKQPVKVLIVEDSEDDAKLALRALRGGGFDPTYRRVQTAAELETALGQERWDAVISDFQMPGFTGVDALKIFRSTGLDIPFILVSGTIGEETAVDAMKSGASDYIMKKSLARLAPALERELKETQMRAAHRRVQEALTDGEKRFRQMAENISDAFFLRDADAGRMLYISPAYEKIWGRSCESLYANPASWGEAIHPDDRAYVRNKKGMLAGKFEFKYRIVRPDGSIRWIGTKGFPIADETGKVYRIAGVAEDITERVGLENALRESEAGLLRAQELARLAHVVTRSDGSFESWSDTLPGLIRADPATMPRSTHAWLDIVHPDDRENFRAKAIEAGIRLERTEVEYRVRRRDFERHIFQVMEPIEGSAGADGRPRWFSTMQDVTERKRAEEEVRRLNADLERRVAERTAELEAANKELEAFDYSISHDLRAPLNRIEGFSARLEEQFGEKLDAHGRDLLLRIAEAGRSMDQLVGDLLALSISTRGELRRSTVDVSALAESIVATLRKSEPQREVSFEAPAGMNARADPGLLRVVLENLLGNAWKFTRRRDDARIEMGCVESEGERAFFVRDNGAGFDIASADKLFTPFQRLHSRSDFEGTGIGLATVQRIVRRHGGRVWAEATVDRGATFFFTLSA